MKFKLLFKQSLRDFKKNIMVMLSFALFLIIIFSMIVGMMTFSSNLQTSINNLTKNVPNAYLTVFKYDVESDDQLDDNDVILKTTDDSGFYNYCSELVENYIENNSSSKDYSNADLLQIFIRYSGQNSGTIKTIENDDNDATIDEYNKIADFLSENEYKTLNDNKDYFYSNNIIINYYIENFLNDKNIDYNYISSINNNKQRLTFDFLRESSEINSSLTKDTPDFLLKNKRGFEYQEVLSVSKMNSHQKELYDQGKVIFTTEKNINKNGLKIGQSLYMNSSNNINLNGSKDEELLLMGTAIGVDNFTTQSNSINEYTNYFLPYNYMKNNTNLYSSGIYSEYTNGTNRKGIVFQIKNMKNISEAQNYIEKNELVTNSFSSTKTITYNGTYINNFWIYMSGDEIPKTASMYKSISTLFTVLLLVLLGIVFYFITIQIINSQRKMLYFLKAMGENNFKLSALTTMSLVPVVLVSLVLSLFGSLFVQNMMSIVTSSAFSISTKFWNFSIWYFVYNSIFLVVALVIFFAINFFILRGKALTNKGVNAVKAPKILQIKFKKHVLSKLPSKLNIGISFAIKNLWKNIISLLVLSICFGVILISVQFNSSISKTSHLFEKWNKPYTSLVSNEEVQSFRIDEKDDGQITNYVFNENYEQISNADGVTGINSIFINDNDSPNSKSLEEIIQDIITGKEMDPALNNYYLTKSLTRYLLSDDGKKDYEKLMDKYSYAIPDKTKEQIDSAYTLITQAYTLLNNQFSSFDGFNLFFGKMVINDEIETNNPTFLSMKGAAKRSLNSSYLLDGQTFRIDAASKQNTYLMNHFELSNDSISKSDSSDSNGFFDTLHINVSKAFASNYHIGKNSKFLLEQTISNQTINIKVTVDKILQDNTISNEIYINKEDYFNYLYDESYKEEQNYIQVAQNMVLNHNSEWSDEDLEKYNEYIRTIHNLENINSMWETVVDKINDKDTSYYYLDNSMYSKDSPIPYLLENLTLPYYQYDGEQPSDYNNSQTKTAFNNYQNSVYIFASISKMLEELADPIKVLMGKFIIILIFLTISISIILTLLVLFENKTIIILMKSMGYRTRQVISYLSIGYVIAAILASIFGGIISYYGLSFLSSSLFITLKTTLIFSWSPIYFFAEIVSALWFIGIIIGSISFYTMKQKPKQAFSTL